MSLSTPAQGHRLREVQSPIIPRVQAWVRAHPGTISLGQGVVSFGPPQEALDALQSFGRYPEDHLYGPVEGDFALRELIEKKLRMENGVRLSEERRLMVTAGSNMAFFEVMMAISEPSDEVILPRPYYFNQEMALRMLGVHPVLVPVQSDFSLDLEAIRASVTPRTRAIVTISPNNPTGAVYPEADLLAVNELCRERNLYHLSDEAYEYFTYEGARHFSPGSIPGGEAHTICLYSLSKAYGFAGWRIGYMVVPSHLEEALRKIQDTNLICPPRPSQRAAMAALEVGRGYFDQMYPKIESLRNEVMSHLAALGNQCRVSGAQGAFYLFVEVDSSLGGLVLSERLVREHGVAVIPGDAFGIFDRTCIRIAYGAPEPDQVRQGLERLVSGIEAICQSS